MYVRLYTNHYYAYILHLYIQDLDSTVRVLLHKGGESNAFIREDVDKALNEMIYSVSPARSLTSLISGGLQ